MSNSFSLLLGCGGLTIHGLTICSPSISIVMDFDIHIEKEMLDKVVDFLDSCGLFDSIVSDWNKVIGILRMLRDRHHLISDDKWYALSVWLPRHKKCGGFLRLILNSDLPSFTEDSIIMPCRLK